MGHNVLLYVIHMLFIYYNIVNNLSMFEVISCIQFLFVPRKQLRPETSVY